LSDAVSSTNNHSNKLQGQPLSTATLALHEVIPVTPFLPMDSRIICSLIGRIFMPFFSAISHASEVSDALHEVASAPLSGIN
jgi:hypothetical protein